NDVYGHRLGDEVLKVVAKRLTRIAQEGSVARLGGDEFGIILRYRLDSNAPERLARRIVHEFSKPIPLAALVLQVGVSVGVSTGSPGGGSSLAMAKRDGGRVETALRQADMAMYWAKAEGRGRYRFFDRTMDERLQQRVELEGEIEVGVSVGGTIYDDQHDRDGLARRDGSAVETALRQADMAMYRAKTEGRGMYRFFDAAMDARLQERVQLEREIKGAIARGEIVPYYQPLVDLNTQTTIGYELLARWEHPTRGLLLPEIFIPIAEDTNSIADLTYSVLSRAVRDAKDRPQDTFLSLNLSPRQFADPWLSQKILAILTEAGFPRQAARDRDHRDGRGAEAR
ncbi:MAG: diguanylate cyclase, partial [Methyloceanibacter sp.]|nr:diguanylate cyclase [Methyloceanibacter sp.]